MYEIEIISNREMPGIKIFFNQIFNRQVHRHKDLELIWNINKPLNVFYHNTWYNLSGGDIILINTNELHELKSVSESATILCLQIKLDQMPNGMFLENIMFDDLFPMDYFDSIRKREFQQRILNIMRAYLVNEPNNVMYCTCSVGLLLYDIMQLVPCHLIGEKDKQENNEKNNLIERLVKYIEENYMEKIRLSDFAEQEQQSLSYMSHLIKKTLNVSFQEYVTEIRLNAAIAEMQSSDKRMLDICYEVGFSDYRYFSSAFQKKFQMTPKEYKKLLSFSFFPKEMETQKHVSSQEYRLNYQESIDLLQQMLVELALNKNECL